MDVFKETEQCLENLSSPSGSMLGYIKKLFACILELKRRLGGERSIRHGLEKRLEDVDIMCQSLHLAVAELKGQKNALLDRIFELSETCRVTNSVCESVLTEQSEQREASRALWKAVDELRGDKKALWRAVDDARDRNTKTNNRLQSTRDLLENQRLNLWAAIDEIRSKKKFNQVWVECVPGRPYTEGGFGRFFTEYPPEEMRCPGAKYSRYVPADD